MNDEFNLHEDEWGMIDLVPVENRPQSEQTVRQAEAHAEAHRAPDGVGWTAMYIAPAPEISLSARGLTLDALTTLLGPGWRRAAKVNSGYGRSFEPISTAFALLQGSSALYGSLGENGVVRALHLDRRGLDPALAPALHRLGTLQRLIAIDLWIDRVVDLADRHAVDEYLAL
jgi:hypothetical protein